MAKRWRLWLGIVISLAFLFLAVRQVNDFGTALTAAREANYIYLAPALVLYFVGVWVRGLRWHYLLKPVKSVSAGRLFPIVVIGYMANDILPARIGELVRAYVLGERESISKSATFATIVIERLFDGLIMLLFIALVSPWVPAFDENLQLIVKVASAVLVAGAVVLGVMAASRRFTARVLDIVFRVAPATVRPKLSRMADSFISGLSVMQNPWAVLQIAGFTAVAWLFESAMYFVLAAGFNLALPFQGLVLTTAVANLGTMVPSSPGYVGTFEALCVFTLGLFGADPNLAFSYTVVLHAALVIPVVLLGVFYLSRYNLSLGQASRVSTVEPMSSSTAERLGTTDPR